jgi:hypothetical protein
MEKLATILPPAARPAPAATPNASPTSPPSSARLKAIAATVTMDLLGRQQPLPEEAVFSATVQAWDRALARIPDPDLGRALAGAMQAHAGSYPLAYGDVLSAYEAQRAATTRPAYQRPALPPPQGPNGEPLVACPTCQDARWVVDPSAPVGGAGRMMGCPRCNRGATWEPAR